jgi:uncharacterized membrane protein YobD (UPF0266 family)
MPFIFKTLANVSNLSGTAVLVYTVPGTATSAIISNIVLSSGAAVTVDLLFGTTSVATAIPFARVSVAVSTSNGFFNEITLAQGNALRVTCLGMCDVVVFGAERI